MRLSIHLAVTSALLAAGSTAHASGLSFDITYTQAVMNDPNYTQIENAVNYVTGLYSSLFSNNVTLNFTIDENNSTGLSKNAPSRQFSNFNQIVTALGSDGANVFLPSTDPTAGLGIGGWEITTAEAKALGIPLTMQLPTASDGTMTFNPDPNGPNQPGYTFDPANQAVPGEYDFIAAVEHEFSEMMGRDSQLRFSALEPYDLFRFTAPGVRSFSVTAQNVYFSVNDGTTNLETFNWNPSGDIMDWKGDVANDPFNAFGVEGQGYVLNSVDLLSMNAIGWESAAPEPSSVIPAVLGFGLIVAVVRRRRPKP